MNKATKKNIDELLTEICGIAAQNLDRTNPITNRAIDRIYARANEIKLIVKGAK